MPRLASPIDPNRTFLFDRFEFLEQLPHAMNIRSTTTGTSTAAAAALALMRRQQFRRTPSIETRKAFPTNLGALSSHGASRNDIVEGTHGLVTRRLARPGVGIVGPIEAGLVLGLFFQQVVVGNGFVHVAAATARVQVAIRHASPIEGGNSVEVLVERRAALLFLLLLLLRVVAGIEEDVQVAVGHARPIEGGVPVDVLVERRTTLLLVVRWAGWIQGDGTLAALAASNTGGNTRTGASQGLRTTAAGASFELLLAAVASRHAKGSGFHLFDGPVDVFLEDFLLLDTLH